MTTILSRNNETFIAGEDLSTAQFKFVKLGTVDNTVLLTNDTAVPSVGILIVPSDNGNAVTVTTHGRTMIQSGSADAITAGDPIASDSAGLGLKLVAGANSVTMGYALEAAVSGQLFAIELIQGGNIVT